MISTEKCVNRIFYKDKRKLTKKLALAISENVGNYKVPEFHKGAKFVADK